MVGNVSPQSVVLAQGQIGPSVSLQSAVLARSQTGPCISPTAAVLSRGWLVVLSLKVLWHIISVYIGPSPIERGKEDGNDRREKKVLTPPPLSLLLSELVGHPGTGNLPSTIAQPDQSFQQYSNHIDAIDL